MAFPRMLPHQKFSRYVYWALPLIDEAFAIGIPLTAIHEQLNRESGYSSSFGTFANALSKARKEKRETKAPSPVTDA